MVTMQRITLGPCIFLWFAFLDLIVANRARRTRSGHRMLSGDLHINASQANLPPKLTIEQREMDRASLSYIWSSQQCQTCSLKEMYCPRSTDGCKTVDGWPKNHLHYLTFDKVVEELAETPQREVTGMIRRLGDLGGFIFNDLLWAKDWKTFPIGADLEDHRKVRPVADRILGRGSKAWDRDMIRGMVEDFFQGNKEIKEDIVKKWVTKVLHKILFNMDITDIEASDFEEYKSASLSVSILPRWLAFDSITGLSDIQYKRDLLLEKYMHAIKVDTRGLYPKLRGHDLRFAADFALTAMTSAGGVSVPLVIRHALAVVFGDQSPLSLGERKLTSETLEPLTYEVIRRYPVVLGFPWWTPDLEHRVIPNMGMALLDPKAWDKPEEFKLRTAEYTKKAGTGDKIGVAFAEQAKGYQGLTPDSRGCPARDLTMTIVTEFLRGIMITQGEWMVTEMPQEGIKMPEGGLGLMEDFTLTRGQIGARDGPNTFQLLSPEARTLKEKADAMAHSMSHDFNSKPERTPFQCPSACEQCCKRRTWWGSPVKEVFKCVIQNTPSEMLFFKVRGRDCTAPEARRGSADLSKSYCKFSKAERESDWHLDLKDCRSF